jgi:hypothetical protein
LVLQVYHTHGTYDAQVYTGVGRKPLYRAFASGETLAAPAGGAGAMSVTLNAASITLISGYSDITVAHINGTVTISSKSGTFTVGEVVTYGANSAIYITDNGSTSMTLANVLVEPTASDSFAGAISGATADCDSTLTDANTSTFAFTQQSSYSYSVCVEAGSIYEAGRSLSDMYAYLQYICSDGKTDVFYTSTGSAIVQVKREEYVKAVSSYAATKSAPFGTLAGVTFFGAQGIWVQGTAASDANNIKLTDHSGSLRFPYTSVNVIVGNTRVDDDIAVYLESGTTGLPDKATYTSHNTNNAQGDSTFERDATDFPVDTPASGSFTVVDTNAKEEHRYRYTSWATTVLTLPTKRTGAATAGSTGQTLIASGATFQTWLIQRGDIIRNTTDSGWGYIESIDSETQVKTTQLTTAGKDWASGDNFEINALVVTYDNTDTFFIPYMTSIETTGTDLSPGSETVVVLYLQTRNVVVVARNVKATVKIQPFVTTSTIGTAGMNVSIIRNTDTVYSG